MKQIKNLFKASVSDIEADGLMDTITKIHVVGLQNYQGKKLTIKGSDLKKIKSVLKYHIKNEIPIVGHNFITYDTAALEYILGMDLSELMVVDTLALSWYLNFDREIHGLDSFFDDYGIAKPKIDDWENLSYEEYVHRVTEDVKINVALWDDLRNRLFSMYELSKNLIDKDKVKTKAIEGVDEPNPLQHIKEGTLEEYVNSVVSFIMFKMDCARNKEKTKINIDTDSLNKTDKELTDLVEKASKELESVMPLVPKYKDKKKPAKPFLLSGKLSASGLSWNEAISGLDKVDELGNPLSKKIEGERGKIKIFDKYEQPNINSHQQIKDWLFSKGWKPQTFKFVKDKGLTEIWVQSGFRKELKPKPRAVPQLSKEVEGVKELCPSVLLLSKKIPEIKAYENYTLIKHRWDCVQGFKESLDENNCVQSEVGGFTNTFREKHRKPIANLPSASKMWGEEIRGFLKARKGKKYLGSDLSSLEDRVKNNFCLPHDPEYVESISQEGYDPHLNMCLIAGMIEQKDYDDWTKLGIKSEIAKAMRPLGKTVNYSCLPVDNTEVLTISGWKFYKDLTAGDRIISYNTSEGILEEDSILKTHHFKDRECVTLGQSHSSIESTEDHRWYGWQRSKTKGKKSKKNFKYFTTKEINTEKNILCSAKYKGGTSNVTPTEAGFIAWILADGYYKWAEDTKKTSSSFGKKRHLIASLHQSKDKYCEDIEEIISALGLTCKKSIHSEANTNTVYSYSFKSGEVRELFDRVVGNRNQKHENDWSDWVLSLSQEAIESFVYNFWLADGDSKDRDYNKSIVISQNEGKIADAVRLAIYLTGRRVSSSYNSEGFGLIRSMRSPWITGQRMKETGRRVTGVFCLTTGNSNFVIRQNGLMTITGNCVYGASPEVIARSSGMSLKEAKVLHKAYWELHWYVKAIAEEQTLITCSQGKRWLINPINGFLYSIRADKDIFSTLIQGTGSFFFDMWIDNILTECHNRGIDEGLILLYHDEFVKEVEDDEKSKKELELITLDAIMKVNKDYNLRVDLGCDVQFGDRYSEIH